MKNYITNEALPEILSALAEKFIENPAGAVTAALSASSDDLPVLEITTSIWDDENKEAVHTKRAYQIVPDVLDAYNVIRDIMKTINADTL